MYLDGEVDVQWLSGVVQVSLKVLVQVLADTYVLEHPLQLACVLKTARLRKITDKLHNDISPLKSFIYNIHGFYLLQFGDH